METGGQTFLFQTQQPDQAGGIAADRLESHAFLPFSLHRAQFCAGAMQVELLAYTPLIPHDLQTSATPVLCMELSVQNRTQREMDCVLRWRMPAKTQGLAAVFQNGQDAVRLQVAPGESSRDDGFLGWYYPEFTTPSPMLPGVFRRYYAARFQSAGEVCAYAAAHCAEWKARMLRWQADLGFPAPFRRLWFSSLSSVITATMLTEDPFFFEIEMPHPWINTMDVSA